MVCNSSSLPVYPNKVSDESDHLQDSDDAPVDMAIVTIESEIGLLERDTEAPAFHIKV